MKSIIPIDETWTVDTFRRQVEGADAVLLNNGLPYAQNPFAHLYVQQDEYMESTMDIAPDLRPDTTDDPAKKEARANALLRSQIQAVQLNLNDYDKAYALAQMDLTEVYQYLVTQSIPGSLIVPELMVTERTSVDDATREQIMATGDIEMIRDLLAPKYQPDVVGIDAEGTAVTSTEWFWKPTGDVMFSVEGQEPIEIPCWPESVKDSTSATWSQEMTTYQHYEPKQTYKGSGPRTVSCTFKIHRAMWDGNQDSGNSERLVAYMESACYPDYNTQAAEPPRSLLVVGHSVRIRGILTSFDKNYGGPIGPDGCYDEVTINISITEESENVLSTEAVRGGLAGWR